MTLGDTTDAGAAVLYDMWQRLGIGEPTGIELGNESSGIVADPLVTPWQTIDLVNRAFGQGVAITPLQLARSFSAMVNGGRLPTPHLDRGLGRRGCGATADASRSWKRRLSDTLRQLMVHVVEAGPHYAEETEIPNYIVGGKTGTAQIWDPARRRVDDRHVQPHLRRLRRRAQARGGHPRAHPRHRAARPAELGHDPRDVVERAVPARRPGRDPCSTCRSRPGSRIQPTSTSADGVVDAADGTGSTDCASLV